MRFYASKNHNYLNDKPFVPESVTRYICLNPKYNGWVHPKFRGVTNVLLDSGAFQDVRDTARLSFKQALERQVEFEERHNFISEAIVSYDRLVDEKFDKERGQVKKRVSYSTAEEYIEETISAAKFLVDMRKELKPRKIVLSNQGVTAEQYLGCIKEILRFSEKDDIIGLGGFCIVGLQPKYQKQYFDVLERALSLIKKKGIKRIHIFGLGQFKVLVKTYIMCRRYGVDASYDTSSYEFNGVMGSLFNPEKLALTQIFLKEDKKKLYHPVDLAIFNIKIINKFWEELRNFDISGLESKYPSYYI